MFPKNLVSDPFAFKARGLHLQSHSLKKRTLVKHFLNSYGPTTPTTTTQPTPTPPPTPPPTTTSQTTTTTPKTTLSWLSSYC